MLYRKQHRCSFVNMVAFKKAGCEKKKSDEGCLTAETVQGTSLTLQGVDNVHGSDCLSLGMFGVGNSVTDHVLQENLENTAGLFVDETGDALHTTTASQTTDGWLGDPLDVVTKDFPVALSASLSETFASFSTPRHVDSFATRRDSVENLLDA